MGLQKYDKEFLKQLDYRQNKTIYVKIISLDINDYPREEITGQATNGSINIDGSSKMQRTCSLSIVAEKDSIIVTNPYWCFNNKFKLEIGLLNEFNPEYENIIWFKQGVYIITSFSISETATNFTINISGKDKLCRLDGTIGGMLPHQVAFGEYLQQSAEDPEIWETIKTPIREIIPYALIQYGQERLENIIIKDLDINGFELWEYRGTTPLYLFKRADVEDSSVKSSFTNLTFDSGTLVYDENGNQIMLSEIKNYYYLTSFDSGLNREASKIRFTLNGNTFYVVKIEYGQTAGYHEIELIYNSELIMNAGENIIGLLDKLVAMLGPYEYFYDVDGRFIFQKKRTYTYELFSPIGKNSTEAISLASPYAYEFEDKQLFTSISNTPSIDKIKNDYTIWSSRKGVDGTDIPIHARFALHTKPTQYVSYDGNKIYNLNNCKDWREIIYQMALDFQNNSGKSDFYARVEANNPEFVNGCTGYETYYSDLLGFWRQLYYPMKNEHFDTDLTSNRDNNLLNEENYYTSGEKAGWNKSIYTAPETLSFWFDFFEPQGELKNISISYIGYRPKNDSSKGITGIAVNKTPEVQYKTISDKKLKYHNETAYIPLQINEVNERLFARSSQGQDAISRANEILNESVQLALSKTITSIPIFYLEPNTRIKIGEEGDYTLDKISYSLAYNGTMNITANKIIKNLI